MLAQGCVLGHAPVYVQDVQVAQGALVLVPGIVIRHVPMHVLPGVKERQVLIAVVVVAVALLAVEVGAVVAVDKIAQTLAISVVEQAVSEIVLAVVSLIAQVVVEIAVVGVLTAQLAVKPHVRVVILVVAEAVLMFVKELAENPLVREEMEALVPVATVHLPAKVVVVMLVLVAVLLAKEAVKVVPEVVKGLVQGVQMIVVQPVLAVALSA